MYVRSRYAEGWGRIVFAFSSPSSKGYPHEYRQFEFPGSRSHASLLRSCNCHPAKIAPHPVEFSDTLFRYFEKFPPLRRSRKCRLREIERSTMATFSSTFPRFVSEERTFRADPAVSWASPFLQTGYEYSFYRVLFSGGRRFSGFEIFTRRFSMDFVRPDIDGKQDFDVLIKFRHRANFCEKVVSRRQTTVYDNDHSFWLLTPCAEYLRKLS